MRAIFAATAAITVIVISACSTSPRPPDAVDDYVLTSDLVAVDKIKPNDRDKWSLLTDRYILYQTRKQTYLFGFRSRCPALYNRALMQADQRFEHAIRPRVDTINGCKITEMYELTPDQLLELQNLGTPPGTS